MAISKKDYEAIAAIIKKETNYTSMSKDKKRGFDLALSYTAANLAMYFKQQNINFDYKKFFLACGLDEKGNPLN